MFNRCKNKSRYGNNKLSLAINHLKRNEALCKQKLNKTRRQKRRTASSWALVSAMSILYGIYNCFKNKTALAKVMITPFEQHLVDGQKKWVKAPQEENYWEYVNYIFLTFGILRLSYCLLNLQRVRSHTGIDTRVHLDETLVPQLTPAEHRELKIAFTEVKNLTDATDLDFPLFDNPYPVEDKLAHIIFTEQFCSARTNELKESLKQNQQCAKLAVHTLHQYGIFATGVEEEILGYIGIEKDNSLANR